MKKTLTVFMLIILALAALVSGSVFSERKFVFADIDGDGDITGRDNDIFDRYLSGWRLDVDTSELDVDGDGMITDWDSIVISRYLDGWNVEVKVPKPDFYINKDGNTLGTRFNPPEGYTRVDVEPGSFGEYLRNYPLKPYGSLPLTYTGEVNGESSSIGVLDQADTLIQNQQCADTVMMLYAEYLHSQGRYDEISFNFLSGFKCEFSKWAEGYRDKVSGNKVEWVLSTDKKGVKANDYSYENLVKYLKEVYSYANTDSLSLELPYVKKESDLKVGDVFIATKTQLREKMQEINPAAVSSISYGHAVIIGDIAVNSKGEKVYLLIEGTTPATDCAVVENPNGYSCCWFKVTNGTFVKNKSGIKWETSWGHRLDRD